MMLQPLSRTSIFLRPLVYLSGNWVSRMGVVAVNTAVVFWLFLLPTTLSGAALHPYVGILTFMALPGLFFLGLALIPLGIALRRRRELRQGLPLTALPPLHSNTPELRRLLLFVGITTAVNLIVGAQLTYGAVHYMDSIAFCGRTCHEVMQPEYAAYQNSPHARVECVACHIGAGANWFVKSKLSGVAQVFAVAFNTYPRPIPTPIRDLRPARETCETCHWPDKFGADRLRVIEKFAEDEANTRTQTVLLMLIGGGGVTRGIHGVHIAPGVTIEYAPGDASRQSIPWVRYRNTETGHTAEYLAADAKPEVVRQLPRRQMDCMDCHNRPTHAFEMPESAVDRALAAGRISAALPFVKKVGVELLKKDYASHDQAAAAMRAALRDRYGGRAEATRAAEALAEIYQRNVFPRMKVGWGTYVNNIGHTDFPGCFRCHDDRHSGEGGRIISQDCNSCHRLLAMEETAPKVLSDLGVAGSQ